MKNLKQFDELNEAFDWQDFDDTDLAGPSWQGRCEDLVNEFKDTMNKEMPIGVFPQHERKQALAALAKLFANAISDASAEV
jgi:hypothetical protein